MTIMMTRSTTAATHPNERRWGSVFVGGGGVLVVMGDDDMDGLVVGEGVEGEEGGVVVADEVLSEVEDEVLNVAFG